MRVRGNSFSRWRLLAEFRAKMYPSLCCCQHCVEWNFSVSLFYSVLSLVLPVLLLATLFTVYSVVDSEEPCIVRLLTKWRLHIFRSICEGDPQSWSKDLRHFVLFPTYGLSVTFPSSPPTRCWCWFIQRRFAIPTLFLGGGGFGKLNNDLTLQDNASPLAILSSVPSTFVDEVSNDY